ncbi:MAG: hypothetical protein MT490_04845 [Sphingomonas sp.]|uniref:hypothetical protein n=1 Tax=Sphingomonas sp. TaxID=28214 RepID=UPI002274C241|nr:hypothetical protein [Sphingomonas sp.]MCX8475108.1 hypothetical protein [Sphingomonas sp.]
MIYARVRDWVDGMWRESGQQAKVLVLPAILPALALFPFGRGLLVQVIVWGWFALWTLFVAWRYWRYMSEVSVEADLHYDRIGKMKLPAEYHVTESATATARRKKTNHD